jgi:putative membrane protein
MDYNLHNEEEEMFMNMDKILTEEFKNKIKETVLESEKKSGGEIVTYLAEESDGYNNIYWTVGFYSAFLGSSIFILSYRLIEFVASNSIFFLGALFLFPLLIISILFLIRPLRLLFISKNQMDYYVNLKAKEAFLDKEVFNTQDRTGILIYISLFEKRVVVLGDSGINKKVSKDKWDTVIRSIISGIKNNSLAHGIVSGILLCGDILKENNVKRRIRDKNELDDSLQFRRKK